MIKKQLRRIRRARRDFNDNLCRPKNVDQYYIHDLNPKIDRPVCELKQFVKAALQFGETNPGGITI
jgi:hypothetical protein